MHNRQDTKRIPEAEANVSNSPNKKQSLRTLNSSPINKSSKSSVTNNKLSSRLPSSESAEEDDEYLYDEEDFDEESNLQLSGIESPKVSRVVLFVTVQVTLICFYHNHYLHFVR